MLITIILILKYLLYEQINNLFDYYVNINIWQINNLYILTC